jgi:hypothetical protein
MCPAALIYIITRFGSCAQEDMAVYHLLHRSHLTKKSQPGHTAALCVLLLICCHPTEFDARQDLQAVTCIPGHPVWPIPQYLQRQTTVGGTSQINILQQASIHRSMCNQMREVHTPVHQAHVRKLHRVCAFLPAIAYRCLFTVLSYALIAARAAISSLLGTP